MGNIRLFETATIRSFYHLEEDQWYFSIVDIIAVLTNSTNPADYLKKLRKRDVGLGTYLGTNCPQVSMLNQSGVKRKNFKSLINKENLNLD